MRVQGTLQAPLPQQLRRKNKAPEVAESAEEPQPSRGEIIRLAPEVDYIPGDERLDWDERQLSHAARRALQGYWSVAHQGNLWAEWRRVDLYV
ncbi:hypothetical protein [Marinospirillum alkaliphilum]|uniref:Uncharacterized protein n=1 Tax=Marinospirillum alkaliphilum DSM 21637 TaxID=1122209 RepID=A0A1K1VEK3_9GAMM|nr:hypothetical protein [Marinospirillum alkaliphilum]SFX23487.1 hypothetical protein SAMN02745752_00928 [Marinospirillum alkaliphilum DSM 21637]